MNLPLQPQPARPRGTALIVVMALLAIMGVLMVCTAHSLYFVKRELKLIEQKQLHRLEKSVKGQGPEK